ncbi:HoxN/HupN/NixA family nickel/cobalt transporter [Myceligenerans indicum]|uniref:Nickel/cobalt efflux system n=1 Tax=Myceligenerans indicum TaxID=2593663 RepID=A0ABS1LKK0_9MICO|nr:HoxN/HupN/NixA family nickel/cobalt transporter [Myceligenerans indicum]MBL0886539.1 high-affinity nickel-transport protein [Myceligenerans indicum]
MTSSSPAAHHPGRPARRTGPGRRADPARRTSRVPRGATVPVVVALHALGIGGLAGALALDGGAGAITAATGLAAYALGLRHAFDADHIATIDNTTRSLVRAGRDARGVGLWFSLGHSTVVLGAALLLTLGIGAMAPALGDESSTLRRVAGIWGPVVSGTFLLAIAVLNLAMLRRALHGPGSGTSGGSAHGHRHPAGGPVTWMLRRLGWATERPGRMYAVGLVFGLGFDTATEIGLLAITASAALGEVAWYAAVPLALLFAAGMSLLDSVQGAVARRVYAQAGPGTAGGPGTTAGPGTTGGAGRTRARGRARVRYDVVVTGVSALAALGIGTLTLARVVEEHAPWAGRLPGAAIGLEPYGVVLTVVLLVVWGAGLSVLRQPRREA